MGTMLTDEDNREQVDGEAMRYEITIGNQVLMLMQALDGLRVRLGLKFKKSLMEFLLD